MAKTFPAAKARRKPFGAGSPGRSAAKPGMKSSARTTKRVLVFSLQSSKRESLDYIHLLQTIDHLAARKDQRREPVEGDEVLRVLQRRLLGEMPTEADSTPAATAYQE